MTNDKVMTDQQHYDWLISGLSNLHSRTKLFNTLKKELSKHGHWKDRARYRPAGNMNLTNYHRSIDNKTVPHTGVVYYD